MIILSLHVIITVIIIIIIITSNACLEINFQNVLIIWSSALAFSKSNYYMYTEISIGNHTVLSSIWN